MKGFIKQSVDRAPGLVIVTTVQVPDSVLHCLRFTDKLFNVLQPGSTMCPVKAWKGELLHLASTNYFQPRWLSHHD
jgi:hypothetical protein